MRKLLRMISLILAAATILPGCSATHLQESQKLQIVSTIFPGYDFARQVCADKAEVTLLLPPGGESHTYEPTPRDILQIQNCDLFICTGGESESWAEEILDSLEQPVPVVRMLDCTEAVYEENPQGIQDKHHEHKEQGEEYDEHVWTSPVNAVKITEAIRDAVCQADSQHRVQYEQNCSSYTSRLKSLDADFAQFWESTENKVMIFGDRFPFRYFVDRYQIQYYAAFPGCAAETEPSAATMAFLINKIKELDIRTVFYIEFSSHTVADALAEATGAATALFHSCHSVSKKQLEDGVTYIDLMEENLETLKNLYGQRK